MNTLKLLPSPSRLVCEMLKIKHVGKPFGACLVHAYRLCSNWELSFLTALLTAQIPEAVPDSNLQGL